MTIPVGNHGLTCLDGSDYSAVALWMQDTADSINESLSGIQASLNTYLDRPYFSMTNTSSFSVDSASGTIGPEGAVGQDLTSLGSGNVRVFNDLNPSTVTPVALPAGIYLMQSSVNYTVATPNNNTTRTLYVYGLKLVSGIQTFPNLYTNRTYEAGGAGNSGALSIRGLLQADGSTVYAFGAFFSHQNTSSTIAIASGAWNISLLYMGSGLVI